MLLFRHRRSIGNGPLASRRGPIIGPIGGGWPSANAPGTDSPCSRFGNGRTRPSRMSAHPGAARCVASPRTNPMPLRNMPRRFPARASIRRGRQSRLRPWCRRSEPALEYSARRARDPARPGSSVLSICSAPRQSPLRNPSRSRRRSLRARDEPESFSAHRRRRRRVRASAPRADSRPAPSLGRECPSLRRRLPCPD